MLDKFNDFKKKDMLIESCGLSSINSCGGYSGNYSDSPSESELKEERRRKIIKRREERFSKLLDKCDNCKTHLDKEDKFCRECGTKVDK